MGRRDALYTQQILTYYRPQMSGYTPQQQGRRNGARFNPATDAEIKAAMGRAQAETQRLVQSLNQGLQQGGGITLNDVNIKGKPLSEVLFGWLKGPSEPVLLGTSAPEPTTGERISAFVFSPLGAITGVGIGVGGFFAYRAWSKK